jgi:hypothetical protein
MIGGDGDHGDHGDNFQPFAQARRCRPRGSGGIASEVL